ncbi:uncharacterized protein PFL1_05552 [Pseudozyma flocculosa PF-1]|uniref:Uncharacterized protein n=1 Tax=Pseudozyma flocculosa PF-1 TaxID=1277687 RepID=A0A061H2G0_9BASI|nr:uncharacterized protein PFL1_05552 [Pseudozyma flocculosa PF-1]EPQ26917.1 hypothetical protein PFL1_05552 [Pseudozyma flocculosa PF-1]
MLAANNASASTLDTDVFVDPVLPFTTATTSSMALLSASALLATIALVCIVHARTRRHRGHRSISAGGDERHAPPIETMKKEGADERRSRTPPRRVAKEGSTGAASSSTLRSAVTRRGPGAVLPRGPPTEALLDFFAPTRSIWPSYYIRAARDAEIRARRAVAGQVPSDTTATAAAAWPSISVTPPAMGRIDRSTALVLASPTMSSQSHADLLSARASEPVCHPIFISIEQLEEDFRHGRIEAVDPTWRLADLVQAMASSSSPCRSTPALSWPHASGMVKDEDAATHQNQSFVTARPQWCVHLVNAH